MMCCTFIQWVLEEELVFVHFLATKESPYSEPMVLCFNSTVTGKELQPVSDRKQRPCKQVPWGSFTFLTLLEHYPEVLHAL